MAVDPTVPTLVDLCQTENMDVPHLVYSSVLSSLIMEQMGEFFFSIHVSLMDFLVIIYFRRLVHSCLVSNRVLFRTLGREWPTQGDVDYDTCDFQVRDSVFWFSNLSRKLAVRYLPLFTGMWLVGVSLFFVSDDTIQQWLALQFQLMYDLTCNLHFVVLMLQRKFTCTIFLL